MKTDNSSRWNVILIVLMFALELQELVVTASIAVRIATTNIRPGLVHRAAARLAVEETADGAVDMIFVVPQRPLIDIAGAVAVGEAAARLGFG